MKNSLAKDPGPFNNISAFPCIISIGIVLLTHYFYSYPTELFFNSDETRHVMTSVFFRDIFVDLPLTNLRQYSEIYYSRYPAIGVLIWPPLFYAITGLAMVLGGISIQTAKLSLLGFNALGLIFLYRLVRKTHTNNILAMATVVFAGLSPLYFTYSHHVMLEVPTASLGIISLYYFLDYLETERARSCTKAAVLAALAALTKFTAIFLLPLFIILAVWQKRARILISLSTIINAILAVIIVLPYYAVSFSFTGSLLTKNATQGVSGESDAWFSLSHLFFYPGCLPDQIGWTLLVCSIIGITCAIVTKDKRSIPYFAWIISCYLMFTPLAELSPRHTIYWIPPFGFFAAMGIWWLAKIFAQQFSKTAHLVICIIAALSLLVSIKAKPKEFINGYQEAAQYVYQMSGDRPVFLFDGVLNGNFIYYMRKVDKEKRSVTIRGSKIFFAVYITAKGGLEELVSNEKDILSMIRAYSPSYIIVEDKNVTPIIAVRDLLRDTLRNNPDLFVLEKSVPLKTNLEKVSDMSLLIYRNKHQSATPAKTLKLRMLTLDHDIIVPLQE